MNKRQNSSLELSERNTIPASNDARAPKADITNAPHLFGDPQDTLAVFDELAGDPDLYGEPDLYGDIGIGSPRSFMQKHGKKIALGAAGTAATAATIAGATAIARRVKERRAAKEMESRLSLGRSNQSLRNQRLIRSSAGKLDMTGSLPFFQLKGAKLTSAPIDPMSAFPVNVLKQITDRMQTDTPFLQETAIGVRDAATGDYNITVPGVAASRFFGPIIVQFGSPILNASPASVLEMELSIPTTNGTVTVAGSDAIILNYNKGFQVTFMIHPWTLIQNKAELVLGSYKTDSPIKATIKGLPDGSSTSITVPGVRHPYMIALRNSMTR